MFHEDTESEAIANEAYRNVRYTDENIQIVYMSLEPKQEIGMEVHPKTTQFFKVEYGICVVMINSKGYKLSKGQSIVVPPNAQHNVINPSRTEKVKLYTIYSPPEHPSGTFQKNK